MPLPAPRRNAPTRLDTAILGTARLRTASAPLDAVLLDILDWAVVALPAHACSVVIRAEGAADAVSATDAAVALITSDGVSRPSHPLHDALATRSTVIVGGVDTDLRWRGFAHPNGRHVLRSMVATGVTLDERTTAVLAHWSTEADAFEPVDVADAADFAAHLAPVLLNAVVAADLRRRNENLATALTSRALIDQAIGIVMSRTGSTADQALARLRAISQREHVKVHEVARRTVRDAVNRTRIWQAKPHPAAVTTAAVTTAGS